MKMRVLPTPLLLSLILSLSLIITASATATATASATATATEKYHPEWPAGFSGEYTYTSETSGFPLASVPAWMAYSYTDEAKGWIWVMKHSISKCALYAKASNISAEAACIIQFPRTGGTYMVLDPPSPDQDMACCVVNATTGPMVPNWLEDFTFTESKVVDGVKANVWELAANQLNVYTIAADATDVSGTLSFGITAPVNTFAFAKDAIRIAHQPTHYFDLMPPCASATACPSPIDSVW